MWTFEGFYMICFGVGFVYACVVGFLAGILGGDHDFSGNDVDISGHDIDAGMGGSDFSGGIHFSPFSPAVISTFLVVFGGSGLVYMRMFQIDGMISILPSLVTAIIVGIAVFLMFDYVFKHTQGGVEVNIADLIGREAEVITTIPADGMGEIAFSSGGGRINTAARSERGETISKNSIVRISKIVGTVYIVRPLDVETESSPQTDFIGGGSD